MAAMTDSDLLPTSLPQPSAFMRSVREFSIATATASAAPQSLLSNICNSRIEVAHNRMLLAELRSATDKSVLACRESVQLSQNLLGAHDLEPASAGKDLARASDEK